MQHDRDVTKSATPASSHSLPFRQLTRQFGPAIVSSMVTRAKKPTKKAASKKQQAAVAAPRSFWLGAWMGALQVTTEQLADRLGVDRVTIWRYETGERQPQKGRIARIAAELGIEPSDLWRQPAEPSKPKLVDLNAAAAHITDNDVRLSIAEMLAKLPPTK